MERSILNIAATMLVLFFVSAGTAGAIVNVNYQVLKGTIASDGTFIPGTAAVNNAGFLGFVCANAECSSVSGSLWGGASQSTGSDNKIMLQYPTTLISPYGYMVWVHKDGYIPWTYEANWYGTGTAQGTYTKYLSKKEGCHAHIDDFVVINDAKPNIPLQVYVDASLDATTYSALMCNTDNYVPQELRDDLSADTRVTLTIYDSYGHAVFSRSSDISLYCSTAKRVEFTWTPTEAGSYRAVARTDVIDSKCSSAMPEQTSKDFTVIADEPDQTCYTLLNNLQISNPYPKVGDVFDIEFTKLSNHAADTLLTPVTTDIKMRVVRDATGDVMASESQTLTANPDSYNPVWIGYTLDTAGFPAGSYTIIVDGTTSDSMCDGLEILDETVVLGFYLDHARECTPGEDETVACGTDVGQCSFGQKKRICDSDGFWGDYGSCTGGVLPSDEICDGLDNDCDYLVDEGNVCGECTPGDTETMSCGSNVGVCEYGSQTRECLDNGIGGGVWGDYGSCTGGIGPSEEICDNLDNDCDGQVDEGNVCAPMITDIPDVTFAEDSCSTIDLDDYVTDPDNSADELDWTVSGNTLVDIDIDPLSHIATFCSAQDWNGREYVLFSVWDPDRSSDSDNVIVTVTPADDAPVISDIPDILFPMNSCASLDLDSYVDDPDNDDSELDWTVSGNINVDINIDPVTHIAMFCSSDDWHGKEHVVFTVVDPDRLSDSDDAMVTVPGPEGNLSVQVIYPNGGEILRGDAQIKWLAISTHECSAEQSIKIEYSPDAGRSWHLIADDEENDGAYDWDTRNVPDQATYLIKVTATDCAESAYDISDGTFTINNHRAIHEEEEKNIYGLYISQILFVNPFADLPRPGDELDVRVYISNSGGENLDDLRISAYLPDFGERSNSVRLDLDKGQAARKDLYLWVPDYAQPGEYAVRIVMQNTRVKRVRHRYITVS